MVSVLGEHDFNYRALIKLLWSIKIMGSSPCSSEDRALASGARCKGSSPFRGSYFATRRFCLWVKFLK